MWASQSASRTAADLSKPVKEIPTAWAVEKAAGCSANVASFRPFGAVFGSRSNSRLTAGPSRIAMALWASRSACVGSSYLSQVPRFSNSGSCVAFSHGFQHAGIFEGAVDRVGDEHSGTCRKDFLARRKSIHSLEDIAVALSFGLTQVSEVAEHPHQLLCCGLGLAC